jgi:hypothetical protein
MQARQDIRRWCRRGGQFLAGWHDCSERDRIYGPRVLRRLTWHNLGWRLARHHHDPAGVDDREVRDYFEMAEEIWWQQHP